MISSNLTLVDRHKCVFISMILYHAIYFITTLFSMRRGHLIPNVLGGVELTRHYYSYCGSIWIQFILLETRN